MCYYKVPLVNYKDFCLSLSRLKCWRILGDVMTPCPGVKRTQLKEVRSNMLDQTSMICRTSLKGHEVAVSLDVPDILLDLCMSETHPAFVQGSMNCLC